MADQDDVNQGAIPPKVSPFAKTDGVAPLTPVSPGAPRPITVRLKPVAPAAETATPAASALEAQAAPAAVAAVAGIPAAPAVNPRATARVPVPESVTAAPAAIRPMTVRLRPVAPVTAPAKPDHEPGSTQPIAKIEVPAAAVAAPMQPQHPPAPGSNPLPDGPKPPSSAQIQAAKSKTSRISLDSAIGVAPVGSEKEGPKTIRLKRPTDLGAPPVSPTVQRSATSTIRQTSRIPDSALPTAEAAVAADSSSVTQKKTLKIKRPGVKEEAPAAEGEAFPEGVQMTPISPMEFPAKTTSSLFTTISAIVAGVAAVVLLLLTLCLGAHAMGPNNGPNALASLPGPELPWAGGLSN